MTAKEVHLASKTMRSAAYTTTLTKLQFMHKKGLLARDESEKSHVYSAVKTQFQTERSLVRSLVRRTFAGSTQSLVLHAMSLKKVPPEEIDRIKQLFRELEGEDE